MTSYLLIPYCLVMQLAPSVRSSFDEKSFKPGMVVDVLNVVSSIPKPLASWTVVGKLVIFLHYAPQLLRIKKTLLQLIQPQVPCGFALCCVHKSKANQPSPMKKIGMQVAATFFLRSYSSAKHSTTECQPEWKRSWMLQIFPYISTTHNVVFNRSL